jgi:acetone carboxylase gamma subunit
VAETIVGSPEYGALTGAWAPARTPEPVLLREYVCPGCTRLLDTEVVVVGTPREDDVRPAFWVRA